MISGLENLKLNDYGKYDKFSFIQIDHYMNWEWVLLESQYTVDVFET